MGLQSHFPRETSTIPMLELDRLAAKPCMAFVCANGKRHLTSAEAVSVGHPQRVTAEVTAGGGGARCCPGGRV